MRREYAEMLIARGDGDRAREELLRETLREAEAGGMSQLISRVRVRLDEIDRRLTEPLPPPPEAPRHHVAVAVDNAPGDDRQPDRRRRACAPGPRPAR